jgi:hypothetical protein
VSYQTQNPVLGVGVFSAVLSHKDKDANEQEREKLMTYLLREDGLEVVHRNMVMLPPRSSYDAEGGWTQTKSQFPCEIPTEDRSVGQY